MRWATGLLLALGCLSAPVLAQRAPDPLKVCSKETDDAARLACFDHEMQRRSVVEAAQEAQAAKAVQSDQAVQSARAAKAVNPGQAAQAGQAAAQDHTDDNVGLDGKQLLRKLKEQGDQPKKPVELIVATITRLVQRPDHEYLFELDNGQVWEQIDTAPGVSVRPREAVTIRPGVLGAFFLKTQARQSIRVHRVR